MNRWLCLIMVSGISLLQLSRCGFEHKNSHGEKKSTSKKTGVHSSKDKFMLQLEWRKGPIASGYSEAAITILTAGGEIPKSVEDIKVQPWMKIHGHGTGDIQPQIERSKTQGHLYHVKNIYFIMPGPWELNIEATVNGATDRLEYSVEVLD